MSNQFTTAVIGEGGLRRVMEGVRTVRLVAALAVAALLAGGWMMSAPLDDIAEGDGDEGDKVPASLASEEDSGEEGEPELRRGEKEGKLRIHPFPERLIAGGAGALGSLVLGLFMLEFVKVTVLVALVSPMLARMKAQKGGHADPRSSARLPRGERGDPLLGTA
ncbi:MAG: hypothetical protein Ct9H300mP30_0710 [Methanobacteriota archaeon]|nr:MAG: hypothetical protein Ct9H300mP30_0710 [Euryarchaeota archaeon]